MDWKEVKQIYYYFTSEETGQTLDSIRLVYDNSLQGKGIPNSKFHGKIPNSLCMHLIKYIDTKHTKGKKLTCCEILNWLWKKHAVYCSKHTLSRDMLDNGLSYKPSKPKIRNNHVARLDQIIYYLISLHALLKLEKEGKVVLIFLDESYFNTTHSGTHSWYLSTGKPIQNKSTSRGWSLIYVHDITKDGPLCDFDVIKGRHIDEMKWKGNTPHADSMDIKTINEAAAPLPLTSELIWLSDSHTGDYHDNTNGKIL